MRGAARAIGWELFRHHRLGLAILGVYLVAFWTIKSLWAPDAVIKVDPPNGLAALVVVPLGIAFMFFISIFSYGLGGDLGALESAFPRRMFTLPISTRALAGWPMIFGTGSSVVLWLTAVALAKWAGHVDAGIPWIWPALLLAVFLAWMQALTWMSYPLRGLRIVVAVLLLVAVDAVVILAIEFHARESTLVVILAPQILFAYVVGYYAVARARRGVLPDWRPFFERWGAGARRNAEPLFSSPARAQAWLEWRRHGRTLPTLVAWVVPAELLLLFLPGNEGEGMIFVILFVALVTVPAMALLAAPALSAFTTYTATRPMTNVALVAAKLEMTVWSTLAAWVLAVAFTVCALLASGAMPVVVEKARDLAEVAGPARAAVLLALLFVALVAATWKNLVQSLCIGLTGRTWVIRSSVLAALILIVVAFPILWILVRSDTIRDFAWNYLPWMLVGLVWLKVSIAAWIAIRLHDRKVFDDRALVAGAVCWLVAVAAVYGVLAWIAASPVFPFYFLGALAILAVPLARLSAAPLALASSRHR